MDEKKRGRGRPTKKNPSVVAKIYELARKGKTALQISKIIGINPSTIGHWMRMDIDFSIALRESRQEADELVEAATFKRALGYEQTYTTQKLTNTGKVVTVEETVHIPPNPTSQLFWLKNRKPHDWKDRIDHEVGGKDGEPINIIIKDYTKKENK